MAGFLCAFYVLFSFKGMSRENPAGFAELHLQADWKGDQTQQQCSQGPAGKRWKAWDWVVQKPETMDLFGWKIDGTNVFSNFIFCTLQKKNVAQLILPKKSYLKRTVFCKPLIFWNFRVQIRWTYSCWFIDVLMSPFVRSKMRLGLAVIHFVATCCVTRSNRVDLRSV